MGGFFSTLWGIYTGFLKIIGNTILVTIGIGLCAYAMVEQYQELHVTSVDVAIFGAGIALVSFSLVRRLVWLYVGLAIPWIALVAAGLYLAIPDFYRFTISPAVLAVGFLPPAVGALLMEFLPHVEPPETEPHLEITLDAPIDGSDPEDETPV